MGASNSVSNIDTLWLNGNPIKCISNVYCKDLLIDPAKPDILITSIPNLCLNKIIQNRINHLIVTVDT